MTTEKISEREHGKGHVTATTVPCKLWQWDRYRVPQNVFLLSIYSHQSCWLFVIFTRGVPYGSIRGDFKLQLGLN